MKKALLTIALLGILLGLSLFVVPLLFDTQYLQGRLVSVAEEVTGRSLVIKGPVRASLLPRPHVGFEDVRLANPEGTASEYMAQAEELRINLAWSGLFSREIVIDSVLVRHPKVDFETYADGRHNWDFATSRLNSGFQGDIAAPVTVEGGSVRVVDVPSGAVRVLSGVHLQFPMLSMTRQTQLEGGFDLAGVAVGFRGAVGGYDWQKGQLPLDLALAIGADRISLRGAVAYLSRQPQFDGTLHWESHGGSAWFAAWLREAGMLPPDAPFTVPEGAILQGGLALGGQQLRVTGMKYQSGASTAEIESSFNWGAQPSGSLALRMPMLNLDEMATLINAAETAAGGAAAGEKSDGGVAAPPSAPPQAASAPSPAGAAGAPPASAWEAPRNIALSLTAAIDRVVYRAQPVDNVSIRGDVAQGEMVINQAFAALPGGISFLTFGILRQGNQGATYEGSVETGGKSLKQFLDAYQLTDLAFGEDDAGSFTMTGNLYLSPKEFRLSETKLQMGPLQALGAAILYFDDRRLESALGVKGLNLDHVMRAWKERKKSVVANTEALGREVIEKPDFDWVKALPVALNVNARVDNYVLNDRVGESASFTLKSGQNRFAMTDLRARYADAELAGEWSLDMAGAKPRLEIKMALGNLDASLLDSPLLKQREENQFFDENREWSKKQLEFPFLDQMDGQFDIAFRQISRAGLFLNDGSFAGRLNDAVLTVDQFKARLWGGQMEMTGKVNGGAVPGFSGNITLSGADLAQVFIAATDIHNLSGTLSLNGTVAASGVNAYSWASNANGRIRIAAQRLGVDGFDLPGIVQAVAAVRSVADIVNVSRLALPGGKTEFSSLGGLINVEQGKAEFLEFTFGNPLTHGTLTGTASLPQWLSDLVITLHLVTLGAQEHPALAFKIAGRLDTPKVVFDTQLLEAYVAKLATQRMMEKPPSAP